MAGEIDVDRARLSSFLLSLPSLLDRVLQESPENAKERLTEEINKVMQEIRFTHGVQNTGAGGITLEQYEQLIDSVPVSQYQEAQTCTN